MSGESANVEYTYVQCMGERATRTETEDAISQFYARHRVSWDRETTMQSHVYCAGVQDQEYCLRFCINRKHLIWSTVSMEFVTKWCY
jgi:hypothetical protein